MGIRPWNDKKNAWLETPKAKALDSKKRNPLFYTILVLIQHLKTLLTSVIRTISISCRIDFFYKKKHKYSSLSRRQSPFKFFALKKQTLDLSVNK